MPTILHYLVWCLPALLPLPSLGFYSGDEDFLETSGGQLQNDAHAPDHKWLSIARKLRSDVASARDEQFRRDFGEIRNMTEFEEERKKIETPLLSSSDGCFPAGFNGQKCLRRIYSGLRIYHVYLVHIEQESQSVDNIMDIKLGTSRLLYLLKETVNVNDGKDQPTDLSKFADTAWNQRITTHSILYNYVDFMIVTSRAINYMKPKKIIQRLVKEDKELLKHQQ